MKNDLQILKSFSFYSCIYLTTSISIFIFHDLRVLCFHNQTALKNGIMKSELKYFEVSNKYAQCMFAVRP